MRDCDDSDSFYTHFDLDGDGYSTCDGECDDDSLVDMIDQDGDGVSICDLDCDDSDSYLNTLDADNDGISTCDGDTNDTGHPTYATDNDNDGVPITRIAAMGILGGRPDWMIGSRMALTKTVMGLMRWPPFHWAPLAISRTTTVSFEPMADGTAAMPNTPTSSPPLKIPAMCIW